MGIKKDIVTVVIGIAIIGGGVVAIFGTTNPFYVVSSGSMIPAIQVHDVLVVSAHKPFEEVQVGDIIVFNRPVGEDRVIVHRVASIIDEDPRTIRTKGDANPASIPGTDFPITEEEYLGHVEFWIPQVGYITRVIQPPINFIIIAVIVGIMIARHFSNKKKKEKELGLTEKEFEIDENKEDANEDQERRFDKLDEIPRDNTYSESAEKVNSDEKIENYESEADSKDKTDEKT